ncbi:MAG: zf-HC2 domain-containing protein [Actinomycetota bacterium]
MRPLKRLAKGSPADMARCMEAIRNLDAYLDEELRDHAKAERIAEHLEVCEDCGLEARTVSSLKVSLRRMAPEVDPGTLERLRRFAEGLENKEV